MKRFLYIVAVILVSLLLVGGMLVTVLSSSQVETAAVRLVTAELAQAFGTKAQVGAVEYRFPARIAIRDIYIEDEQRDTLVYVGEVFAHFSPLALRHNEIRFSHAHLSNVVANLYPTSDTTWNYSFITSALRAQEQQEQSPFSSILTIKDVQFDSIRIRYDRYVLNLPHADMDLNHFSASSLDADLSKLEAQVTRYGQESEQAFNITHLSAHVLLNDSIMVAPTLKAQLPHSRLDLSGMELRADSSVMVKFHEARLTPSDIAFFVPNLRGFQRPISLSGALTGSVDSLYFEDIVLRYAGRVVLEGDVAAFGLPDISNPYLRANLKGVHTNAAQLQDFLSQLYMRPIQLPVAVHRLGGIHYRGLAEGRLHDLTLHGAFKTALGSISTDGTFRSDSLFTQMNYDARVVARSFQLGRLLNQSKFGAVTLDVYTRGQIDHGLAYGDVDAHVREFTYNEYTFSELSMNGRYEPKRYQGEFEIHDPHLDAAFDGVVDLHDVDPEINFNLRCRHFDTEPLLASLPAALSNRTKDRESVQSRFALAVDMNGINPDEMSGYLVMDSLFVATPRDSVLMKQLKLVVKTGEGHYKLLTLNSDYIKAQAKGNFRYVDIPPAMQALIHYYLPSAVPAPTQRWERIALDMYADGDRLRDVQRLFEAPLILSDHPSFTANIAVSPSSVQGKGLAPYVSAIFSAPGVRAASTPVHDLTVSLLSQSFGSKQVSPLTLTVSAEAMSVHSYLRADALRDTVLTHLVIDTTVLEPIAEPPSPDDDLLTLNKKLLSVQRAGKYGGDLSLLTRFDRYAGQPLIMLEVLPGTVLLRDSVYTLAPSTLTYCAADTSLAVEHFDFSGGGQHIRANGLASPRATDTIALDLQRLDASYIVPFILPQQVIMFNGLLTGKADVTSLLGKPQFDTQIHVDSMGLNNCYFGDADVDLHITDSLVFHADVYRPTRTVVALDGKALLDPAGTWRLDMITDSVPLQFVNHWTSKVLDDLDGTASGHVVVGGKGESVYVLLRAQAQNASLTLPWTGVRYTIPADTIIMDTTTILFPNVHLVDAENHPVLVNGDISHDQFRDFVLNLHVHARNALVFDKNRSGEMLQGHVYASGFVDVTGEETDILVHADANTARNSTFRLSLDNAASAYESSFVHFVEHPKDTAVTFSIATEENDLDNIDFPDKQDKTSEAMNRALLKPARCQVKLDLNINDGLLFQLVLGERNGDMIQGRGTGSLRLTYDTPSEDVTLYGNYDLSEGTLNYTVANVIRKEFTIQEGTKIVFSGNPEDPQLDVHASYRAVANLRDLFGDETEQLGTSRSNIPVLTILNMTGPLSNPILSFDLQLPSSDQTVYQQVKQVINTDEMLMRQVIYLLVFNKFFTPDYMTNARAATLNSTYSLLSSTVTGQINAWLSKLTTMLTLGVAIRMDGEGSDRSQEYEAQFQLQPVDRLVINGNVGYRYNDIVSSQPFFGDLDVEVLLTEDGQLRLKGYTHTVDKYSLRQAATIQGVGLVWKKDFNWPKAKKKKKQK